MAVSNNVLRFYIDDNDIIYKCDFFEEKEFLEQNSINLSQEELLLLFKKYIENEKIQREEKIDDHYILFKFYNVDKKELIDLIKNSKLKSKVETSKFKTNTSANANEIYEIPTPINNKPRRVTRKNRFRNVTVKVGAALLVLLIGFSIGSHFIDIIKPKNVIIEDPETTISITTSNKIKETKKFIDQNTSTEENIMDNLTFINPVDVEYEEEIENNTIKVEDDRTYDQYINVEADDWTTTDKYKTAKDNYYDLIIQYAHLYGIDPQIALGIACHERGVHSREVDSGGGLGLYQVQIEGGFNWDNKEVVAYNFDTNSYESYTIHKDEIRNVEQNIKAGLMIFQEALRRNNYDIAKAIQEYNYGYGWMRKVLNTCYDENNPETEFNKYDWLDYRNIIKGGDPIYVENVLKYIDDGSVFEFKTPEGKIITCKYDNLSKENEIKNRF